MFSTDKTNHHQMEQSNKTRPRAVLIKEKSIFQQIAFESEKKEKREDIVRSSKSGSAKQEKTFPSSLLSSKRAWSTSKLFAR